MFYTIRTVDSNAVAHFMFMRVVAAGASEKGASDLLLGAGFHWVLWFPPPIILYSHDLSVTWQKK